MAAAFGLTRLMSALLFRVEPRDTLTFVSIPLLLAGVALAATHERRGAPAGSTP